MTRVPPAHDPTDRSPAARTALQAHLAAIYDVQTAEECILADRVVDVLWRLQGVRLALRTLEVAETIEATHKAAPGRFKPLGSRAYDRDDVALDSYDPEVLQAARDKVDELVRRMERGADPSVEESSDLLVEAVGPHRMRIAASEWSGVSVALAALPRCGDDPAERARVREICLDEARKLRELLDERIEQALRELRLHQAAQAAMAAGPTSARAESLTETERALAKDFDGAVSTLRGAVGRRRLAAIGRAWLAGG